MALKILLTDTSRWSGSARLGIALSEAACSVSAVCPFPGHALLKVSGITSIFPYSSLRPLSSLADAIATDRPHLIVPCDDRAVQHLHELHAELCQHGEHRNDIARERGNDIAKLIERSLGSPQGYSVVSGRHALQMLAREEGLRAPISRPLHTVDDAKAVCAGGMLPVVLKADGTCGGNGVKIARTPEQAEQFFLELTRKPTMLKVLKRLLTDRDRFWLRSWRRGAEPAIIAQSYIRGRPANCAAACWEGALLAAIAVEAVTTQAPEGPATIVRVVKNHEMLLAAERIAGRLGLSGFFGLDFMIEEGTGAAYLIELNPRCTQLSHVRLGKGRDLIGALCAKASGEDLLETPPVTQKDMIAYFPQAWSHASEYLQSSFPDIPMGEIELIRALLGPSLERRFVGRVVDRFRQPTATNRRWNNKAHARP